MGYPTFRFSAAAMVPVLALALAGRATAAVMSGGLLGVFSGNDSEHSFALDLGLQVEEVGRVDWPGTVTAGLRISVLAMGEPGEALAGEWAFSCGETVDFIVVKAGHRYAAYRYVPNPNGGQVLVGTWDTSALGQKGLSHLTAYRLAPEPSTAWLLSLGLGLLGARRRQRSRPRINAAWGRLRQKGGRAAGRTDPSLASRHHSPAPLRARASGPSRRAASPP